MVRNQSKWEKHSVTGCQEDIIIMPKHNIYNIRMSDYVQYTLKPWQWLTFDFSFKRVIHLLPAAMDLKRPSTWKKNIQPGQCYNMTPCI